MEPWRITHAGKVLGEPVTMAWTDSWPDTDDEAALVYDGPHGPAYVAYHDGFRRTRVWGPNVPGARLDDGPEDPEGALAKGTRLRDGVQGTIGDQPVLVRGSLYAFVPNRRQFVIDLGDVGYALGTSGWFMFARAQLNRPDGRVAVQSAIRTARRNRMAIDITPDEVALHLLLYSTLAHLRPRLP